LAVSLVLVGSPAVAGHGDESSQRGAPAPTIAQVESRLAALDRRAEIASEASNTARVHVRQARSRLSALEADLARQQRSAATLRQDLVTAALSHFTDSSGLSTAAAFLASRSPGRFIDSLAVNAVVEHQQAGLLERMRDQAQVVAAAKQRAAGQLADVVAEQRQLARHRAQLHGDIRAARDLLAQLKRKQRQRVLARRAHQTSDPGNYTAPSREDVRPPTGDSSSATGRAAVAVATALAQVGKPYVYGAAGPYSFDCSGLTMYAWAAAGVSLSHSSSIQSEQGVPVSISDLRPGDLVFYYSPVSHVAMYIGNGMVVHAPHPGASVQVVPLSSMPISWARRVG
jgi:cell wall-associated NlpC family hydrolase